MRSVRMMVLVLALAACDSVAPTPSVAPTVPPVDRLFAAALAELRIDVGLALDGGFSRSGDVVATATVRVQETAAAMSAMSVGHAYSECRARIEAARPPSTASLSGLEREIAMRALNASLALCP